MEQQHNSYYTVKRNSGEVLFKEKGSKFLGFACKVLDTEQVGAVLEDLRDRFPSANHHCYAWLMGPGDERFRVNDDGEPSGSAGNPILGQIRSYQLHHTLVVVVRFFGGTKLGVGGLIQAYKTAASLALDKAGRTRHWLTQTVGVECPYAHLEKVMRIVKREKLEILDQQMDSRCRLRLAIRNVVFDRVLDELKETRHIQVVGD